MGPLSKAANNVIDKARVGIERCLSVYIAKPNKGGRNTFTDIERTFTLGN